MDFLNFDFFYPIDAGWGVDLDCFMPFISPYAAPPEKNNFYCFFIES